MPYTHSKKSDADVKKDGSTSFVFGKENYILFAVGIALIVVGFYLMSGGSSDDPNVFNPEVFSGTRITTAPLTVLAGFGVVFAAIMYKSKE